MDCIRSSVGNYKNHVWKGDYENVPALKNVSIEQCKQACVSDLNCKAWRLSDEGVCSHAKEITGELSGELKMTKGSGRIECVPQYNLVSIMLNVGIVAIVIFIVYMILFGPGSKIKR